MDGSPILGLLSQLVLFMNHLSEHIVAMEAKTTAGHPVLVEIEGLLVTKLKSPLESGDFSKCLGISSPKANGGRPCSRGSNPVRQARAKYLIVFFRRQSEISRNEAFYELVKEFIEVTHCTTHIPAVMEKFTDWINVMSKPIATMGVNLEQLSPDHVQAERQLNVSSLDELQYQLAATPRQTPRDLDYTDEESLSDDFSSLAMSPGQDSDISFPSVSDAGTTLTTPDRTPAATPLTYDESPTCPYDDLRPETPTPASRHKVIPTVANDLEDEEDREVKEVLRGYQHQPLDVQKSQLRRFGSQKRGKRQLLCAIEKPFGGLDLTPGRVYVWRHEHIDDMLKIGWTSKEDSARHNKGNCYAINTKPVWESEAAFVGSYRVEQIVHKQLRQQQVEEFPCGSSKCGKGHREWFKYSEADAINLIEAWTKFVTLPAYVDGFLSESGRDVMDRLCNFQPERLLDLMKETRAEKLNAFKPQVIRRVMTISEEAETDVCVPVIDRQPCEQNHEEPIIRPQTEDTENAAGVAPPPMEDTASGPSPSEAEKGFLNKARATYEKTKKKVTTSGRRISTRQKRADVGNVLESVLTQYYAVELKLAENMTQPVPGSKSKTGLRTWVKDWCSNW
jgi:hypothetical protein